VEDLVNGSEWIVEGTVGASHAAWDSAHKFIWTHYEVKVLDSLHGARQASITVSEPGGALDGIEQSTSGTLPYFAGEHVVLFLYRTPIGYLRTAGAGQGKFTVGADGRARANMLGISVTGAKRGTPLNAIDGLPLADFKLKLRALARTGAR
jgi:hypothetical protein